MTDDDLDLRFVGISPEEGVLDVDPEAFAGWITRLLDTRGYRHAKRAVVLVRDDGDTIDLRLTEAGDDLLNDPDGFANEVYRWINEGDVGYSVERVSPVREVDDTRPSRCPACGEAQDTERHERYTPPRQSATRVEGWLCNACGAGWEARFTDPTIETTHPPADE